MLIQLVILLIFCHAVLTLSGVPGGSDIKTVEGYSLLAKGKFGSNLYTLKAPSSVYVDAPLLVDIRGPDSFSQGFDVGLLLGKAFVENYNNLLVSLLGDEWWEPAVQKLVNVFLDWQWSDYLSKQVPPNYLDELKGLSAGGLAAGLGVHDVGKIAARGVVLANLPGSLENIVLILKDELAHPSNEKFKHNSNMEMSMDDVMKLMDKLKKKWNGIHCSNWGSWGSRTQDGKLFSGRNLDWLADTGISKYKVISVHHPPNGHVHATVGFAGIWGALTGLSSQGLTVHEANLESNDITWRGFPWILRLREVMSKASNIEEGLKIWQATNNTVGFNHGIGSAKDGKICLLETMMHNTAIFYDNDPREQSLIYNGQQIAAPRTEAVYRTNHGYDPYTVEHYMWNNTGAYENSIMRYLAFPEAFDSYQASKTKISSVQAVNITAILGSKGPDMYTCGGFPYNDAENILSVAFDPTERKMYASWENGHGPDGWMPAACSTYLEIDMKPWFQ